MTTPKDEALDLFSAPTPESDQAQRIIAKFGGVAALVKALGAVGYKISRFSIYKWTYARSRSGHGGTGGIIPPASREWVALAALERGITLLEEDWNP